LIESFIKQVRMIPGTNKVGTIGFCWGGRYAILAGDKDFSGAEGMGVDAVYACHPSLVAIPGDFEGLAVPASFALGDSDSLLGNKEVDQIKELMAKKKSEGVDTEVRVYEDQVHGFALRGDWNSEKDKKAMDASCKQGIDFFNKHLA
jgi:dienelactone hydrolase